MKEYHEVFQQLPHGSYVNINIYRAAKAIEAVLLEDGISLTGVEYLCNFPFDGVRVIYHQEIPGFNIPAIAEIKYLESGLWRISVTIQSLGIEIRKDKIDASICEALVNYGIRLIIKPHGSSKKGRGGTAIELYSTIYKDGSIALDELTKCKKTIQDLTVAIIISVFMNSLRELDSLKWKSIDKASNLILVDSYDEDLWYGSESFVGGSDNDEPIYEITNRESYYAGMDDTLNLTEMPGESADLNKLQIIKPDKNTHIDWR